jgi:hypothetical protein
LFDKLSPNEKQALEEAAKIIYQTYLLAEAACEQES